MKIALISQPFDNVVPPSLNSIGLWVYETSRRLAKKHAVIVYARRGISQRKEIGNKVQTKYFFSLPNAWLARFSERITRYLNPKKPSFALPFTYLEYILPIALDLRRQQVDIVHLQNFSQFVPILRAFNPKIKIVLHMRCEWLELLDYDMVDQRLDKTDQMLGVSKSITDAVRKRFPQHASKCTTAYTGVDVNDFQPPGPSTARRTGGRKILYVGRITPEKGIHVLLEAFKQIAERFPDAQLELVGAVSSLARDRLVGMSEDQRIRELDEYYKGTDYLTLLKAILPANLHERVQFTGHLNYARMIETYQNADLLVNPSLTEPFGRSLIEANACGVPVIASRVGGMTELIEPGKNGLLVMPGNARQLAEAMQMLLDDSALRQRMGAAGHQFVLEHFSWDQITSRLVSIYGDLLDVADVGEQGMARSTGL